PAPSCTLTISTIETTHCTSVNVQSDVGGTLEMQFNGVALAGPDIPTKLNANEAAKAKLCKAGHYTARLTAENGAICDAATDIVQTAPTNGPFLSGYFGKERRIRAAFPNGRCAPMIGIDGGYSFYATETFELAPTFGVGINTRDTSNTSLYAELE